MMNAGTESEREREMKDREGPMCHLCTAETLGTPSGGDSSSEPFSLPPSFPPVHLIMSGLSARHGLDSSERRQSLVLCVQKSQ